MPDRYVDDGGLTPDGLSWATAYTSTSALQTAEPTFMTTSGNRVFIGHDHFETQASPLSLLGPTSGQPCLLISATRDSNPPTYEKSAVIQIETTGVNQLTFDGAFAGFGVFSKSGDHLNVVPDNNEFGSYWYQATFRPAYNRSVLVGSTSTAETCKAIMQSCTFGCASDSGAATAVVIECRMCELYLLDANFSSVSLRNGSVLYASLMRVYASGCDFSGFTNTTACELSATNGSSLVEIVNSRTPPTWAPYDSLYPPPAGSMSFTNVGPTDRPWWVARKSFNGRCEALDTVYRTGGASLGGSNYSWVVNTTVDCGESAQFNTPWMYGNITTGLGNKTFTVSVANNTINLKDSEVWLEVEFLGDGSSPMFDIATDKRSPTVATTFDVTKADADQTVDATSTWTGTTLTYKQTLALTATIARFGQYRARVCVGKASVANLYIDPKVVVS